MKKLHKYIVQGFIPPFFASFAVTLFILVLQFLAKYQEDLFGKGFGTWPIIKLFIYGCANFSILAMPIAILMASLMTLGNLGERYELAAIKASGISLFRVMYPMMVFVTFLTIFALYLANFLIPAANLKFFSLLYDLQQAKPTFALKPGVFYKGIDSYAIRINKKGENDEIYDVMIYDHTESRGNVKVILADSGKMEVDQKYLYLRMTLYHGISYEDRNPEPGQMDKMAFSRFAFDSLKYKFDMSSFGLKKTDEKLFSQHQFMMNHNQLVYVLDSLDKVPYNLFLEAKNYYEPILHLKDRVDSTDAKSAVLVPVNTMELFPVDQHQALLQRATTSMRTLKNYFEFSQVQLKEEKYSYRRYLIEYHSKFALPIACIIFLFIGAPLGAIIRKGGLGMPTVVSIGFFILFYVLLTQGKKLAREDVVEVWLGIWSPVIVLTPIALFLTYQASTDSKLFEMSAWKNIFKFKKK